MGKRTRRSRIDRLLDEQARDLSALQKSEVGNVLGAYEDARRELLDRLLTIDPAATPATAQRLRVMLTQVEAGVASMRQRMGNALAGAELELHNAAMGHLLGLVKKAEPEFKEMGGLVEVGAVRRLSARRALLLHRYSVDRYGADVVAAIQRHLVAGVAQGLTQRQLAMSVAGAGGSVLAGMRGRAQLIARMETARVYNEGYLETIRELEATDPRPADPALKRIDEFLDSRNHPFSRAAHGVTALPHEEFRVPAGEVQAWATTLKKSVGGITWRKDGGVYRGDVLPAHFNDRGRITAWRASWGPSGTVSPPGSPAPKPSPSPPAPTGRRATLLAEEQRIRGEPEEHLSVVFSDGTMRTTGPAYTRQMAPLLDPRNVCVVPPRLVKASRQDGDAIVTHNHPTGLPFSRADLVLAEGMDVAELRATRPSGSAWVLKRPASGFWPSPRTLKRAYDKATREGKRKAIQRMDDYVKKAGGDPNDGTKAKGFSRAVWTRFLGEELAAALRRRLAPHGIDLLEEPGPGP